MKTTRPTPWSISGAFQATLRTRPVLHFKQATTRNSEHISNLWVSIPTSGDWLFHGVWFEKAFPRLYLAPFNDAQIDQFTRLWWAHHERNPHLAGTKPGQFTAALRQSHGARSLARLPHLLTMIALIYRVIAELPDGRAKLYSLIADAYLGTLDKDRGLDHLRPIPHTVEEMSRWLAAIGWQLQRRRAEGMHERDLLIGKEELVAALTKSSFLNLPRRLVSRHSTRVLRRSYSLNSLGAAADCFCRARRADMPFSISVSKNTSPPSISANASRTPTGWRMTIISCLALRSMT